MTCNLSLAPARGPWPGSKPWLTLQMLCGIKHTPVKVRLSHWITYVLQTCKIRNT